MWFSTLLSFLITLKLSSADLGLSVAIPDLRSTISSGKSKGIEPINKIVRQIEAIDFDHFDMDFYAVKMALQAVMGNMTEIQSNTLNSLLQAVNDNRSGPRKVLDRLYSDIESAQEQLYDSQTTSLDDHASLVGTEKYSLLTASRAALSSSFKTLQSVLTLMDDSISKAQRVKPVTQENVQNVVTKTQIAEFARGVAFIETSISKLNLLAESSQKSFKLIEQDANKTFTLLDKIFSLEGIFNATESRTTPIEKNLRGVVAKLNSTVLSAYKSLIKSSTKDGAKILDIFLENFVLAMKLLNESASDFRTHFRHSVETQLPQMIFFIDNAVQYNLNSAALHMLKNHTFAELCVEKCPLANESMTVVVKMLKNCVQPQLDYLPEIERMFNDFFQSISALVLAPWEDFSMCSSKLDKTLCLRKLTATYFTADIDSSVLLDEMFQRSIQLFKITRNELDSAFGRIALCESSEDVMPGLMPLGTKRLMCYETGDYSTVVHEDYWWLQLGHDLQW